MRALPASPTQDPSAWFRGLQESRDVFPGILTFRRLHCHSRERRFLRLLVHALASCAFTDSRASGVRTQSRGPCPRAHTGPHPQNGVSPSPRAMCLHQGVAASWWCLLPSPEPKIWGRGLSGLQQHLFLEPGVPSSSADSWIFAELTGDQFYLGTVVLRIFLFVRLRSCVCVCVCEKPH